MSVILINNDDFYGYLVRRAAGGQTKRKYFSLAKKSGKSFVPMSAAEQAKVEAEAKACDEKFAEWQKKTLKQKKSECVPTKRNNTGVRGIQFGYVTNGRRADKGQPGFIVGIRKGQDKTMTKVIKIDSDWTKAWAKACQVLAKEKGIAVAPLLKRMPDPSTLDA